MASEYSWSYSDILYKVYPEDFFLLLRQIKIRRIEAHLTDYRIQASTQSDNKEFINSLIEMQRFMNGADERPEELDRESLEAWRRDMNKEGGMIKSAKIKT